MNGKANSRCDHNTSESVEDGSDGDGCIHAAEMHDGIWNRWRSVVVRLDDQCEALKNI